MELYVFLSEEAPVRIFDMSDIVVAIILLPIMSQKQKINCPFYFSNVPNISLLNGVNGKEVVEERKKHLERICKCIIVILMCNYFYIYIY